MSNIIIKGARIHNLKDICLEIPRDKLVVFTGISGSGKSSLVFDTICAEARRQLIETFSSFARRRLPKISRPDMDELHNISTAIVIDQKRMGITFRSTVGTATELYTYLRLLFSRVGKPFAGFSDFFSFNNPEGMCPACNGLGKEMVIDQAKIFDSSLSLAEGSIIHPEFKTGGYLWKEIVNTGYFDPHKKLKDYTPEEMNKFLYQEKTTYEKEMAGVKARGHYEGIIVKLKRIFGNKKEDENAYTRFFTYQTCPDCEGIRINKKARSVKLNDAGIGDLVNLELFDLLKYLQGVKDEKAQPIVKKMTSILNHLIEIGVGYLSLHRPVATLSGGESQRVKTARQLDCDLVNLMYVLDEPTIGLHPRNVAQLLPLLSKLRDRGNSVFIIEHDVEVMKHSDHIIDIGPEAGSKGGTVTFQGTYAELKKSATKTGKYLDTHIHSKSERKKWTDCYEIKNANKHTLQNVSVKIPRGVFTAVTGVAGSGKSSLIYDVFAANHPGAITVDQGAIGRTSRGTPATFIGIFGNIRKEFASETKSDAALFSFNSKGACPECKGLGIIKLEMSFLDDISMTCTKCQGKRYTDEVLALKYRDNNIFDVLDMTIDDAHGYFDNPVINKKLSMLGEIGLGYLKLGQPLSSLSGGEAQRLKLASELHNKGDLYIMDEPTTGLHLADIEKLLVIIKRLVAKDKTVVVIEHNMDLVACADWVIDLGPDGGKNGGRVVAEGTPETVAVSKTHTGQFLKKVLG